MLCSIRINRFYFFIRLICPSCSPWPLSPASTHRSPLLTRPAFLLLPTRCPQTFITLQHCAAGLLFDHLCFYERKVGFGIYWHLQLPGEAHFNFGCTLHKQLHSPLSTHLFFYICNFNLFWEHSSYFRKDGLHPRLLRSRMLTANILHSVSASPHKWLNI